MDLYNYLGKIAHSLDALQTPEQINAVLDELDRIQDMLDPEFQDAAEALIHQLTSKLNNLE